MFLRLQGESGINLGILEYRSMYKLKRDLGAVSQTILCDKIDFIHVYLIQHKTSRCAVAHENPS